MASIRRHGTERRFSRWATSLGAMALGAGLLMSSADSAPRQPPTHKGDTFLTADSGGVILLEGGECFTDPAYSPEEDEVMVLYTPCDEHAGNQVYGFLPAPEGAFDRERLAAFAWTACGREFTGYWPGEEAAGLDFYPVLPTERTWAFGDRDVMCVVYTPAGELTDSLLPLA